MEIKFIKVQCIKGFHLVRIDQIKYVTPLDSREHKSKIVLLTGEELYSTEDQEEIFFSVQLIK